MRSSLCSMRRVFHLSPLARPGVCGTWATVTAFQPGGIQVRRSPQGGTSGDCRREPRDDVHPVWRCALYRAPVLGPAVARTRPGTPVPADLAARRTLLTHMGTAERVCARRERPGETPLPRSDGVPADKRARTRATPP